MQQLQRYIPSLSDLYGTDEIEFLLDEIKDLEPACCQLDDIQDFEIAGSRAGELSLPLESPLGTVTSWDSHAHYRRRTGFTPSPWGVQMLCDPSHLKTPSGIVRILLVLSSAACLACECSAGTVQVGLFLLPLIGRLRLMVFCALFSLLITCLLLFLDISHIAFIFPFNWGKVNTWLYLGIGLIFIIGSSLLLHMVLYAEAFMWVPKHTKETLFVSAILGYVCAIESFLLSSFPLCPSQYREVPSEPSDLLLVDCEMSPLCSSEIGNHTHMSNELKSSFNQKSYIPVMRSDETFNLEPAPPPPMTGYPQKAPQRNRQGYHYQQQPQPQQQHQHQHQHQHHSNNLNAVINSHNDCVVTGGVGVGASAAISADECDDEDDGAFGGPNLIVGPQPLTQQPPPFVLSDLPGSSTSR